MTQKAWMCKDGCCDERDASHCVSCCERKGNKNKGECTSGRFVSDSEWRKVMRVVRASDANMKFKRATSKEAKI